jgi:hypothetical protein
MNIAEDRKDLCGETQTEGLTTWEDRPCSLKSKVKYF